LVFTHSHAYFISSYSQSCIIQQAGTRTFHSSRVLRNAPKSEQATSSAYSYGHVRIFHVGAAHLDGALFVVTPNLEFCPFLFLFILLATSLFSVLILISSRVYIAPCYPLHSQIVAGFGIGLGLVGLTSGLRANAESEVEPRRAPKSHHDEDKSTRPVGIVKGKDAYKSMRIFSGTANVPVSLLSFSLLCLLLILALLNSTYSFPSSPLSLCPLYTQLAREIASQLGVDLGQVSIKAFADGEIGIQVNENVRGKDVYIIQPTCPPGVNDHLMELILLISTMRRASANTITAVIPYYGYARQDRKMQSRVPISAADVARLFEAMGVDRVVAVDLHCGQIQGFFSPDTPCDNLEGSKVGIPYFHHIGLKGDSTVVVSPDAGGVHRAKNFRDGLNKLGIDAGLAMIIKQRLQANVIHKMDLVGNVEGMDAIIVDDMIDTAGTLTKAAAELKARGAKNVYAFATHGLFSGPAIERIDKSVLSKVVVCNTVPLPAKKQIAKIEQLSIAPLLAQAIDRIQCKESVSSLFNDENKA